MLFKNLIGHFWRIKMKHLVFVLALLLSSCAAKGVLTTKSVCFDEGTVCVLPSEVSGVQQKSQLTLCPDKPEFKDSAFCIHTYTSIFTKSGAELTTGEDIEVVRTKLGIKSNG